MARSSHAGAGLAPGQVEPGSVVRDKKTGKDLIIEAIVPIAVGIFTLRLVDLFTDSIEEKTIRSTEEFYEEFLTIRINHAQAHPSVVLSEIRDTFSRAAKVSRMDVSTITSEDHEIFKDLLYLVSGAEEQDIDAGIVDIARSLVSLTMSRPSKVEIAQVVNRMGADLTPEFQEYLIDRLDQHAADFSHKIKTKRQGSSVLSAFNAEDLPYIKEIGLLDQIKGRKTPLKDIISSERRFAEILFSDKPGASVFASKEITERLDSLSFEQRLLEYHNDVYRSITGRDLSSELRERIKVDVKKQIKLYERTSGNVANLKLTPGTKGLIDIATGRVERNRTAAASMAIRKPLTVRPGTSFVRQMLLASEGSSKSYFLKQRGKGSYRRATFDFNNLRSPVDFPSMMKQKGSLGEIFGVSRRTFLEDLMGLNTRFMYGDKEHLVNQETLNSIFKNYLPHDTDRLFLSREDISKIIESKKAGTPVELTGLLRNRTSEAMINSGALTSDQVKLAHSLGNTYNTDARVMKITPGQSVDHTLPSATQSLFGTTEDLDVFGAQLTSGEWLHHRDVNTLIRSIESSPNLFRNAQVPELGIRKLQSSDLSNLNWDNAESINFNISRSEAAAIQGLNPRSRLTTLANMRQPTTSTVVPATMAMSKTKRAGANALSAYDRQRMAIAVIKNQSQELEYKLIGSEIAGSTVKQQLALSEAMAKGASTLMMDLETLRVSDTSLQTSLYGIKTSKGTIVRDLSNATPEGRAAIFLKDLSNIGSYDVVATQGKFDIPQLISEIADLSHHPSLSIDTAGRLTQLADTLRSVRATKHLDLAGYNALRSGFSIGTVNQASLEYRLLRSIQTHGEEDVSRAWNIAFTGTEDILHNIGQIRSSLEAGTKPFDLIGKDPSSNLYGQAFRVLGTEETPEGLFLRIKRMGFSGDKAIYSNVEDIVHFEAVHQLGYFLERGTTPINQDNMGEVLKIRNQANIENAERSIRSILNFSETTPYDPLQRFAKNGLESIYGSYAITQNTAQQLALQIKLNLDKQELPEDPGELVDVIAKATANNLGVKKILKTSEVGAANPYFRDLVQHELESMFLDPRKQELLTSGPLADFNKSAFGRALTTHFYNNAAGTALPGFGDLLAARLVKTAGETGNIATEEGAPSLGLHLLNERASVKFGSTEGDFIKAGEAGLKTLQGRVVAAVGAGENRDQAVTNKLFEDLGMADRQVDVVSQIREFAKSRGIDNTFNYNNPDWHRAVGDLGMTSREVANSEGFGDLAEFLHRLQHSERGLKSSIGEGIRTHIHNQLTSGAPEEKLELTRKLLASYEKLPQDNTKGAGEVFAETMKGFLEETNTTGKPEDMSFLSRSYTRPDSHWLSSLSDAEIASHSEQLQKDIITKFGQDTDALAQTLKDAIIQTKDERNRRLAEGKNFTSVERMEMIHNLVFATEEMTAHAQAAGEQGMTMMGTAMKGTATEFLHGKVAQASAIGAIADAGSHDIGTKLQHELLVNAKMVNETWGNIRSPLMIVGGLVALMAAHSPKDDTFSQGQRSDRFHGAPYAAQYAEIPGDPHPTGVFEHALPFHLDISFSGFVESSAHKDMLMREVYDSVSKHMEVRSAHTEVEEDRNATRSVREREAMKRVL